MTVTRNAVSGLLFGVLAVITPHDQLAAQPATPPSSEVTMAEVLKSGGAPGNSRTPRPAGAR